ncbi:MAG TPA: TrkA family potassium uptake protein [Candidatus Brocadiia bacterium]|nr:TrkA family potassium uptake protein [Candidatus Brocadiia bacterium]
MSQFAVIGLGRFGSAVAKKLAENGCQVLVMDRDHKTVQAFRDIATAAYIGDATDRKALESLGLKQVDAVILCLGERMEASILAALYLREMGVKEVWAKAASEDHAKVLSTLGVSKTVLPERDTAHRLASQLSFPNMLDYLPLHPDYSIMQVTCPPDLTGKSLRDLNLRAKYGIQVLAVQEYVPQRITIAPDGGFVVKDSDVLIVLGRNEDIEKLTRMT